MNDHTRLINKFIGLCKGIQKWPGILSELGYEVQLIEQTINLQSAQKVTPDVVAVSNKMLHAIVVDCKSGNSIDREQDDRYTKLAANDLLRWITMHDRNQLKHTTCYVDNGSNHDRIKHQTTFPFITFEQHAVKGERDFGVKELNEKLCASTPLNGAREPTVFYPFAPDDDDHAIAPYVLRGLISYLMKKGRKTQHLSKDPAIVHEILKTTHPYYQAISSRHKNRLVQKVTTMLRIFMESSQEFKTQIAKIEEEGHNTATLQGLDKTCQKLIKEYETQRHITDEF